MKKYLFTLTGLAIAVVLWLAVNIIGNETLRAERLDLTQNHLYTLTDGTRNILHNLSDPVTLRLFLSRDEVASLPGLSGYVTRVQDLLSEYQRESNGRIRLKIIDPEPFSKQEDRAVADGLKGVPIDDQGTMLYFGLVGTSSTDDREVIPYFSTDREQFLEYDLTKLIYQLNHPKRPVVGVLSRLPLDGAPPNAMMVQSAGAPPWRIMNQLRQLFKVEAIQSDATAIPNDVDLLMLVHPKGLSVATQYAIDQFVLRGGHAVVFVDPYSEADPQAMGGVSSSADFNRVLKAWGVELTDGKVVADLQSAVRVRSNQGGRDRVLDYPVWMHIQPNQIDQTDVVTANLGNLMLASAGALTAVSGAGTKLTPLVQTNADASEIDASALGMGADLQSLLRDYKPGHTVFNLAVRITGQAKSAFSGPPASADKASKPDSSSPSAPAAAAKPKPYLAASKGDIDVIVVGDTDLLEDRFWVQVQNFLGTQVAVPTSANATFAINALENLAGDSDLISVRNRGSFARSFTRVEALRQNAETKFRRSAEELKKQLGDTEKRLVALQTQKSGDDSLILDARQQDEIEKFRRDELRIRRQLRDVQHALNKDIERLESWTKFINIALMPILIGCGAVGVGAYRLNRRRPGSGGRNS